LFNNGRIGFIGTVGELAHAVGDKAMEIDLEAEMGDAASVLAGVEGVDRVDGDAGRWRIFASRDVRPELAAKVVENGGRLIALDAHRIGLGEAYNRYFKEKNHAA
jgi:ABC-2 type transport system ATP-binding protein